MKHDLTQWEGATALPLDVLLSAIPSLPRPLLARLTERLIERLDERDPDPDNEDDDPANDPLDLGELEDWKASDGIVLLKPAYGLNQSLGPINEAEVMRDSVRQRLAH